MFSTEYGLIMALHTSRQSRESSHLLSLVTYTWMVAFRLHPSIPYIWSQASLPHPNPIPFQQDQQAQSTLELRDRSWEILILPAYHLLSKILKQIMIIPEIHSQSKCREQMTVGAQAPLLTWRLRVSHGRGGRKPLRARGPKHLL